MNRRSLLQSLPKTASYFFASLSLVGILGCVIPVSAGGKMQVELDVFSGRPNQEWTLTPVQVDELNRLVQALPKELDGAEPKESLGYRGLIITKIDSKTKEYSRIVISNGQVSATTAQGQSKRFVDRARRLERWVLQTGKGHLETPLYEQILKQLN